MLNLVMKVLLRAIFNFHAGRIWPADRRLPTPGLAFNFAGVLWS